MSRLLNTQSIVRIVVSLGLLGFLVWRIDLERAADALRNADYLFVLPALAIFTLAKLLVARRWRLMMAEFDTVPPLKPLFAILLVSDLANNIVPARLGDLIRVQVPAERYGSNRARLAATVFATESLLDGIAMISLALIGLALVDLHGFPTGVFWGVLGLVAGALVAIVPLSHLKLRRRLDLPRHAGAASGTRAAVARNSRAALHRWPRRVQGDAAGGPGGGAFVRDLDARSRNVHAFRLRLRDRSYRSRRGCS